MYKIKRLDNIKFDLNELREYYQNVIEKYPHLKWEARLSNIDRKTHKIEDVYSYAIQTNLVDINKPCPPYHIKHDEQIIESDDFSKPTDLVFGFAKKIIDTLPNVRQTVISCHPKGTYIDTHIDNDEFLKIHIPIYTTDSSYFFFDDEKFVLEAGYAYLVNTSINHGTDNQGDNDRIHFITKFSKSDIDVILNTEYEL
jgi:hypothetical protein